MAQGDFRCRPANNDEEWNYPGTAVRSSNRQREVDYMAKRGRRVNHHIKIIAVVSKVAGEDVGIVRAVVKDREGDIGAVLDQAAADAQGAVAAEIVQADVEFNCFPGIDDPVPIAAAVAVVIIIDLDAVHGQRSARAADQEIDQLRHQVGAGAGQYAVDQFRQGIGEAKGLLAVGAVILHCHIAISHFFERQHSGGVGGIEVDIAIPELI